MEREYIVPLRRGFVKTARYKRAKKAMRILREFLHKHTKAEVKIGQHLNEVIWQNGIRNPPGKVKVKALIEEVDGVKIAKVELFGKDYKESIRPIEKKEEESGGLSGKIKSLTSKDDSKDVKKSVDKTTEKKVLDKSTEKKVLDKSTEKKVVDKKSIEKKIIESKTNNDKSSKK